MHRAASDLLPPVLIKELRQGVRARLFTLGFLFIQGALASVALLTLASAETTFAARAGGILLWTVVGVWLLLFVPLRAQRALASEISDRTIELVVITRLTAWRIVAGKWLSLMAQAAVVVSLVLPYLLLRYFISGIDVLTELSALLGIALTSGAATAAMVLASTFASSVSRGLFFCGIAVGGLLSSVSVAASQSGFGSAGGNVPLVVPVSLALATVLALELASARIAPPAENHALRKRIGTLAFVSVLLGLAAFDPSEAQVALLVASLLLLFAGTDAICEDVPELGVHHLPFVRRGRLASGLGRLLCPGWIGGAAFFVLLVPVTIAGLARFWDVSGPKLAAACLANVATLLFPCMLTRGLEIAPRHSWLVAWIFHAVALGLGSFAVVTYVALEVEGPERAFAAIPVIASLGSVWLEDDIATGVAKFYALVLAIEIALLAFPARRALARVTQLEAEARSHLARRGSTGP